ncbi:MAG TPA: TonB-dependent receptor, partial [Candidatus Elarobacter sp.]
HGFLISDDIATATNDFGFGYFVEHQKESGNNIAYDSTNNFLFFVPQSVLGEGDYSFFIRENYTPTAKFGVYMNAWERRSSVTQHTTLDPRISFVFKPTGRDVVRLTGGQADGDPGANVAVGNSLSGFSNPSSLNPVCGSLLNSVATGGNSSLLPERSMDVEAAYGHRFWADTAVNVVGYVSSVKDQLFAGVGPITPFALSNPTIASSLPGFAAKINSACGTNYDATSIIPHLGLSGVFNASSALFRGIELTGRIRVRPQIAIDFGYDILSAQQFGEPANVLANNPYILDGGQINQIPVHKATLAVDFTNRPAGLEAQLQGYYVGIGNTLNRPAYTFFNGFISKSLGKHYSLTVSAWNLFNQNALIYGYFGEQLPNPTNQYTAPYVGPVQQSLATGFGSSSELLGLNPRIVTVQLTTRM